MYRMGYYTTKCLGIISVLCLKCIEFVTGDLPAL